MAIKTCRQMLDEISAFLSNPDVKDLEKHRLWDVLSALRGPDSYNEDYKNASTCLIRYHALGNVLNNFTWVVKKDLPQLVKLRKEMSVALTAANDTNDIHFIVHNIDAFRALGLKWDKLNKVKN